MKFQRILRIPLSLIVLVFILFNYNNCGALRSLGSGSLGSSSLDSTLRRLSNDEIGKSLSIILEDTSVNASEFLPRENKSPYDNDVNSQDPSAPLIQGLDGLAQNVAERLIADTSRKQRVLGCNGTGPNDQSCMTNLIKKLGRLFFRRALTADELNSLLSFAIAQANLGNSFDIGVEMAVRALIQHPTFLYRIEKNLQLNNLEVASRLAFFIWGSGPDDQLLLSAERGELSTPAQIRSVASTMLSSSRAISQIQKFHRLWFGYGDLSDDQLSTAMKAEGDAMVKRILFDENKPWSELLLTNQTTINNILGPTYGISNLSSTPTLVNLPSNRGGLLATAGFLSVVPKFADTSPTMRGKFIRERLLCTPVPPPPPNTNVDNEPPVPPGQPDCKYNRYDGHRRSGSTCFGCHQMMDPIGFGLERYDNKGRYREYDYNADGSAKTTCFIEGKGDIPGMGIFSGPMELSQRLLDSQMIQQCLVKQVFHFGMGEELVDAAFAKNLKQEFDKTGSLKELILTLVTSQVFLRK